MGTFVFKMPDIGEGIVEAEVVAWHVSVGDDVAEDAALADVMTDKATVEITAPVAGAIRKLGCDAGEKMVIGAPFVEFEVAGTVDTAASDPQVSGEPESNKSAQLSSQTDTEKLDSGVSQVQMESQQEPPHSANGAAGEEKTPGASVETGEAMETPSLPPVKPKIRVVSDGDATLSGQVSKEPQKQPAPESPTQVEVAAKDDHAAAKTPATPELESAGAERTSKKVVEMSPRREIVAASPAVRRLARDLGLELENIRGSGPAGRVTKEDIRALLQTPTLVTTTAKKPSATAGRIASVPKTTSNTSGEQLRPVVKNTPSDSISDAGDHITDVPVTGLRRLIAERLQTAKQRIPHFSYVEEVQVDQLESLRQALNSERSETQPKLSVLHFVLLAICREVVNWPQCNAHFDDDSNNLRQHSRVHLGVATMTEAGLMVPVVANACQKDIWELADEVNWLAEAARAGTLSRDDLTGSTITVTSLGALAGVVTTPVINRPETAIVGPNKIMQKVSWKNGVALPVSVMNVSSSFDHRVVDGYDAACFIQAVRKRLEEPALLFVD